MAEEKIEADCRCTQLELYAILRLCYDNGKKPADLAKLFAHKEKYTTAFIDDLIQNVLDAEELPGEEQINVDSETLRIDTGKKADVSLINYRKLKTYITDAFEEEYHKAKLEAAGSTLYRKASNENWEVVKGLNSAMKLFITANNAALIADDNMPATFAAKVAADGQSFLDKYIEFMAAQETSTKTAAKIKANNAIYAEGISLMADGKVVQEDDEARRKYYVFNTLKELVSPPGSASLTVELKNSDFTPAPGFIIKIQAEGKPAITRTTAIETETRGGRALANFDGLDPDPYTWAVYANATAATPIATGKKDVNTGRDAQLKIVLPAPPATE
jgi:hypothetical protein